MLLVDKYNPKTLAELTFHKRLQPELQALANDDLPHLVLYGPSGSGKYTRAMALIRELYGQTEVDQVKYSRFSLDNNSSASNATYGATSSQYHTEVSAAEFGFRDRTVLLQLLGEASKVCNPTLFAATKREGTGTAGATRKNYRVFLIHDAHILSIEAQNGLRRTMEKFSSTLRLIFLADEISGLIPPIRSRCQSIRVGAPTVKEIVASLSAIILKESETPAGLFSPRDVEILDNSKLATLAVRCKRNARAAVLELERAALHGVATFKPATVSRAWERVCEDIATSICTADETKRILDARTKTMELLQKLIPPEDILRLVLEHALRIVSSHDTAKIKMICGSASKYALGLRLSSKPLWQLEAFYVSVMDAVTNA